MSNLVQQIIAAYEAEEPCRGRPVHDASHLPTSYEALTVEWLQDALCARAPGARVLDFALGPVDSGSSNRRRIRVDYNEVGKAAGLPQRLFCKASHGLNNRIAIGASGAAEGEVDFYNHVRGLLDVEAPQCVFARIEKPSCNSLVILLDLTGSALEFCTHTTRMTRERGESQMALLAKLHGAGYSDPRVRAQFSRFRDWKTYFEQTLEYGLGVASEGGFRQGVDVIPPRLYRRADEIWPATLASLKRHLDQPMTLAHGDVHLKNWYVAHDGAMALSDWQCINLGHWGRDFAYTIGTALTVEDRRAWERDLLRCYLDHLHAAGGPKFGFDEAWLDYRQQLMTALTWWTVTLNPAPGMPDMQPLDTTLEFVRRLSTAMDDIDTLDSFK